METIYELGIEIILFLQGLGGWLAAPMTLFTLLGDHTFYLVALAVLYWCINSRAGVRLGLLLMIGGGINYLFKISFASPRPYWYDERVLALSTEATFGVPSGHAQQAVTLWGLLAARVRKKWAWLAAFSLIFLISISRLYLGVHFPHDIVLGWLIGLVLLFGFLALEERLAGWFTSLGLPRQVLLAWLLSLTLIGAALAVRLSLGDWELPELWQQAAVQAAPEARPLEPLSFAGVVAGAGFFFGFAAGAVWLKQRGGFSAAGTWQQRLLRFFIGGAGAAILYLGLGRLLPEAGFIAPVLQYLLTAAVGFWVSAAAPRLFIQFGFAEREADVTETLSSQGS